MNKKLLCWLLLAFTLFSLNAFHAEAVAIGINRADLAFSQVLRDGYSEQTFVVSTDAFEPIGGALEVEGDVVDWVRFEPAGVAEGFTFSVENPQQIKMIIEPPIDAANGGYEGLVRVLTGEISRGGDGQFGTSMRAALKIDILVGITDVEIRRCILGGATITTSEIQQPLDVRYSVKNTGNVRVRPDINIIVYDQAQENIVTEASLPTVADTLPTTSQNFISQLTNSLPPGQYWASIGSEECSGGNYVTFDVLERGGVSDSGELVRIENEAFVSVGDIVPITAVFRNTGSRTVSAKFKGSIMIDNRLVKVIDTDFYDTPPGAVANIETFFNPDAPGTYEIKGRVLYNNKLTFEKIGILNVRGQLLQKFPIVPVIMVLVIIILLLLIRRRRRAW